MSFKQYDVDPEDVVEPVISTVKTPQGVYGKNTLLFKDESEFPVALSKSDCETVKVQQPQLSSGVGVTVGVGVGVSVTGIVGFGVAVGQLGHSPEPHPAI
jgi:hypothetical protein